MMEHDKTTYRLLITSSAFVFSLASTVANAMDTYATSGNGEALKTGYGECWQALHGNPGICGEAPPADSDNDGVVDNKDQCPNTPRGVKVDKEGCPLDTDNDGIADYLDECPGTPKGVSVNSNGCPLDSDNDGVADYQDKCPGTPRGAKVDSVGCLEQLVLHNVTFELNSATLTAEAKEALTPVADALKGRPDITGLVVVGHTDSAGDANYNQHLSEIRAQAVADFFKQSGFNAKITTKGMGETSPIADNTTAEGRARNRRVEITTEK